MSSRSVNTRRPALSSAGRPRFVAATLAVLGAVAACSSAKTPTRVADVAAYSTQYQSGTQGLVAAGVYAYFYDRFSDCTKGTAGGCSYFVCPAQRPNPPEAPAAGTLTFVGTRDALVLESPYLYDPPAVQRTQFGPGATLTLKGSGGADVPAFSATVLGGPSVKVTAPTIDGVASVPIALGAPLEVTWTPDKFGEVVLHADEDTADQRIEVDCRFPAAAGKGSLVTTPFVAGSGQLDVRGETLTQVDTGDWRITFRGFTNALTPAGDRVRVAATFQ
jgi:hypothetical protein